MYPKGVKYKISSRTILVLNMGGWVISVNFEDIFGSVREIFLRLKDMKS
jgi:hypothetical protein